MTILTTTVYLAHDGWRWRVTAPNHELVAESGESFETKEYAVTSAYTYGPAGAEVQVDYGDHTQPATPPKEEE